jgi:hypothetical protein
VPTIPKDDSVRVGAEAIAELIGRPVNITSRLLWHRLLPAFKMGGRWAMSPARWREWQREQENAAFEEGAEIVRKVMQRDAQHRSRARKAKAKRRADSNASDERPAISASPK